MDEPLRRGDGTGRKGTGKMNRDVRPGRRRCWLRVIARFRFLRNCAPGSRVRAGLAMAAPSSSAMCQYAASWYYYEATHQVATCPRALLGCAAFLQG
jgi:hypothetical protein